MSDRSPGAKQDAGAIGPGSTKMTRAAAPNDLGETVNVPVRVQRRRTKGWRMPKGTVFVGHGSRFGNPYIVVDSREEAVAAFRDHLERTPELVERVKTDLRGKNLACWCPPGTACHADVLLEIANSEGT